MVVKLANPVPPWVTAKVPVNPTVLPEPVVVSPVLDPEIVNEFPEGVAVPESVTNELGTEAAAERVMVPEPFVIVIPVP